ncbi:KamA family radical SAM protein [Spirochaeta thermophila]|uniref:L-lysine 2,3-aminomutase n=1 Tax=Winmispira thermophila (strain ATCC 49972 / DSM 6192 / RI 19.B1) TaxID=665571 RepID=E0RQV9_WINT6|nr:KamA family radical SAM protein [Spirochaeta thermophila]ADN03015.1 L-lysine 2,3-aminomutase [Spirochaeta thermophila DSM 6192]
MSLPFLVTPYYRRLADAHPALARQITPSPLEARTLPYETADPLADAAHSPLPRLVHRYPDRALILVTDRCAAYCRFCFRRHFTASGASSLTPGQEQAILAYLREHPEVEEVLLSGGDPLMLPDTRLAALLSGLRALRPGLVIRLGTRIPVVLPARITARLARILAAARPLWVVTHFNHPAELTPEAHAAVEALLTCGLPVVNQTVLLRGVNDHEETLAALFRGLLRWGVKPYYLLQGDLAAGTSHFRTPLSRTFDLYDRLSSMLSGLALPVLAVDLPDGGGKVRLHRSSVVRTDETWYYLQGPDGGLYRYPREEHLYEREDDPS